MLIRKLTEMKEIVAADSTRLRELLHPERDYPFSGRYSLAFASLPPGRASTRHRLKSDEVYYVLSGSGRMHIDNGSAEIGVGDAVDIPPGAEQWLENTGNTDLNFLCIVDPAWRAEDETVIE
ncbi:MAG TPA: cupin domain-containing protein [candidate division Zixibacteria bacterium]|nr:cupin domain-containing protein [candidate division Zixibacteria bacterium]